MPVSIRKEWQVQSHDSLHNGDLVLLLLFIIWDDSEFLQYLR